jgi:hypothetical protein
MHGTNRYGAPILIVGFLWGVRVVLIPFCCVAAFQEATVQPTIWQF